MFQYGAQVVCLSLSLAVEPVGG